jgi:FkbM family methyltransferase
MTGDTGDREAAVATPASPIADHRPRAFPAIISVPLRRFAVAFQSGISRFRPAASIYLRLLSLLTRTLLPSSLQARVRNLVNAQEVSWPQVDLSPRDVIVGRGTRIRLRPHLGEFDDEVLFSRHLTYEADVFSWLELTATETWDRVVEIGANVGVYSIFFDALIEKNQAGRLKDIIVFEPALEPFFRLVENLRSNASRHVLPYRCAIASDAGFFTFFEPEGHLTNGSFDVNFARIFSTNIRKSVVAALSADELSFFFEEGARTLLKIDVEGYEPDLVASMDSLIHNRYPDILIEVLESSAELLDSLHCLQNYDRFVIKSGGLEQRTAIVFEPMHRDWFLRARPPT